MKRPTSFPDVPFVIRQRMASIRSTGTRPELLIRKTLHAMGYRYRLHRRDLPGNPDIVFPARHKVIFVHGCFWHRHSCRLARNLPSVRQDYWGPKFKRTIERDQAAVSALERIGWQSFVVWECETADVPETMRRIIEFLDQPVPSQ